MKYFVLMLLSTTLIACQNQSGNPKLANSIYPMNLHHSGSVSIQVHRSDEFIEIVNSTAIDYGSGTLWINQRFSTQLEPILAGKTVKVDLWSLRDEYGEQFNAGGVWRTDEPTPVVIAELQSSDSASLVGLIVIGQD
jgi:hypothetical protein